MHLSKHHGLGNDFLVLLRDDVVPMPDDVAAALAIRLCHRTRGIGADGLLIGGPPVRRILRRDVDHPRPPERIEVGELARRHPRECRGDAD